jgi:hypothetical protein
MIRLGAIATDGKLRKAVILLTDDASFFMRCYADLPAMLLPGGAVMR